jgi:predicted RNase H-like nuclease (RuvC/YqgF family)
MDVEDKVLDGEVVDAADDVADDGDDTLLEVEIPTAVSGMLSLEELIKNHIESIDKLKLEVKQAKEMFDDSFESNPTYREHMEKVKDVTKSKNALRQQIVKQPSVSQLEQKVKDLRFDLSEKNKTLSDLVQDYKEQTGATSIETRDGKVLEIVSTSKLVKRS